MKTIPDTAACYKSTPEFTHDTVPLALQRDHTTAAGVWAGIHILEGSLRYRIHEPVEEVHLLYPDHHGVVEPTVPHHIELTGPVRFRIDFYR